MVPLPSPLGAEDKKRTRAFTQGARKAAILCALRSGQSDETRDEVERKREALDHSQLCRYFFFSLRLAHYQDRAVSVPDDAIGDAS